MLILTSNGLSSPAMIEKMKPILKGFVKSVIITTASVGYKENDWHIPRLKSELQLCGLSVDYFDFDNQNPELLLDYDVIEISGGNPFYLLQSMKNSDCIEIMKEISESKVIIGISAGALVLQNNINLVAQFSPEMDEGINLSDLSGLALTDVEILPHYSRFISRFERFEERAKEYEETANSTVIRLNDGQGVIVDNSSLFMI